MIRRFFLIAALALAPLLALAQGLTPAQQITVRTFACADTETARPYVIAGDANSLRAWFNAPGSFIVWRTSVTNDELGDAMNGTDVAGLSSLNMQRLQVLAAYSGGSQNMSRADRRAAFDAVFSGAGGAATRAAMAVLWKRPSLRVEQALATGTGTTQTPGRLVYEGELSQTDSVRLLYNDNGTLKGC